MIKKDILKNLTTYDVDYGFAGGDKVRQGTIAILSNTEQYDAFWEEVEKDKSWTLDFRKKYIYIFNADVHKIDNLFHDPESIFTVFKILD